MPSPLDRPDVFARLRDLGHFISDIHGHYTQEAEKSYLRVNVAEDRLRDAYTLWQSDLGRASGREYRGGELDQYKIAGYLCFWLRRMSPIVAMSENPQMGQLDAGNELLQELFDDQKFLYKYANEYLAFEIGFRLCTNAELWRVDNPIRRFVVPKQSFLHDVANTLKTKPVSPHALYLIYYALFEGAHYAPVAN